MDKRYQVFVSSTYKDLQEERAEVMQALLELDCMPSGMELFPAANEEQWNWIKRVIDESDYYIVIVGGRYGSISENTGMSFTEMEYRYAVDKGKPVIAFLHENTSKIEDGKTEQSAVSKKKLNQFRELCQKRLCKYWINPNDLGAKVSRSISQLMKHQPAVGWIRADQIIESGSSEILQLKRQIQELEKQLKDARNDRFRSVKGLSQGDDTFVIEFSYETEQPKINKSGSKYWVKGDEFDGDVSTTWNSIFKSIAPELLLPQPDYVITSHINQYIGAKSRMLLSEKHPELRISRIRVYSHSYDIVKIQLRALGLIEIIKDGYWKLTSFGDSYMNNLFTVKRAKRN